MKRAALLFVVLVSLPRAVLIAQRVGPNTGTTTDTNPIARDAFLRQQNDLFAVANDNLLGSL